VRRAPAVIMRDSGYSWAVACLLGVAFTVAFIDRQALNLLVDPIKSSLGATDTQISLLQGAAFILALLVFIPWFGRWVDMGNRRNILVGAIVGWSGFTMLCGLAHSLPMLFLARGGVGACEAALAPAGWSLMSDYFTERRLPVAVSIFALGPYVGGGLALVCGGMLVSSGHALSHSVPFLAGLTPWQVTFVALGAPGLALALLLLATVREPPRTASMAAAAERERFSLSEIAAYLLARRSFYLGFGLTMTLTAMILYAVSAWMPTVLLRGYRIAPQEVGPQYGTIVAVMGSLGVLAGPRLSGFLDRRGVESASLVCVIAAAAALALMLALVPFVPSYAAALGLAALMTFAYSLPQALGIAGLAMATPSRMRGVVASLYTILGSGVGLGVTPTLVALITDRVFHDPGRVADSLAIVGSSCAAFAVILGVRTLPAFRQALAASTPALAE
jgi:MFS family permease